MLRAVMDRGCRSLLSRRMALASLWLRGSGAEIGALHNPLPVNADTLVRYVDRLPAEKLREQYPDLADLALVSVDILDDGEKLSLLPDDSQDFVIANHFLEHCQDPISAIRAHLRVLAPQGILFLAVPDRQRTFDRKRQATSWEHILHDALEGPAASYESHLREYASLVHELTGEALEAAVADFRQRQYSIHFHVWSAAEFQAFLEQAQAKCNLPCEIAHFESSTDEALAILRKVSRGAAA